jgi:hypothetical protein
MTNDTIFIIVIIRLTFVHIKNIIKKNRMGKFLPFLIQFPIFSFRVRVRLMVRLRFSVRFRV